MILKLFHRPIGGDDVSSASHDAPAAVAIGCEAAPTATPASCRLAVAVRAHEIGLMIIAAGGAGLGSRGDFAD